MLNLLSGHDVSAASSQLINASVDDLALLALFWSCVGTSFGLAAFSGARVRIKSDTTDTRRASQLHSVRLRGSSVVEEKSACTHYLVFK